MRDTEDWAGAGDGEAEYGVGDVMGGGRKEK